MNNTPKAPVRSPAKKADLSPKRIRILFLLAADAVLILAASFLSLFVRFELNIPLMDESGFLPSIVRYAPINVVTTLVIFWQCGLYSSLWEFAGVDELMRIVIASVLSAVAQLLGMLLLALPAPRSYPILYVMFLTLAVMALRLCYRWFRYLRRPHGHPVKRTMLVGAGSAGATVLRELQSSEKSKNKVVCCVDDDSAKWGKSIRGVPIVGGRHTISVAAAKYRVQEIILAIPSVSARERKEIMTYCQATNCTLKTLPGIFQLANGDVSVQSIRKMEIEDLLGREAVHVDMAGISGHIGGQTVLVTGGGGSIGSELCRQIAAYGPRQLIIFDIYENNAYDIQTELRRRWPDLDLQVLIGSVRDRARLESVFARYRPDQVFHAAAHKHVPLMEDSPCEAVKNNILGTLNTAELADQYGVKRFLLISTDKAVNPTNVMGASKRVCEMVIQMVGRRSKTEFVAVRFGNVLGSNGSVIPLFKKQIAEGGPVTVTDPRIIRYFMTIPEAVSLVLQAGVYAKGGEIFILDMGEPVKIDDLARNMIRLSGFEPGVDIPIVYTGLRPGEKLFEELLLDNESDRKTQNNLIYIAKDDPFDDRALARAIERLRRAAADNDPDIRKILAEVVPTYRLPVGAK